MIKHIVIEEQWFLNKEELTKLPTPRLLYYFKKVRILKSKYEQSLCCENCGDFLCKNEWEADRIKETIIASSQ